MVDHNDPEQSIKEGNIICAFDHHIDSRKIKNCYTEEYTSTLLYIYNIFKDCYNFSEYEKQLIDLTVICDSEYITSSRFSERDKLLYRSLNQNIDLKKLRNEYFKTTDLSKSIETIFKDNFKKCNMNDKTINRISIKAYQKDYVHFAQYKAFLNNLERTWIIIWCEYDTNKTHVLVKSNGCITHLTYNYIATSSILVIKELININII